MSPEPTHVTAGDTLAWTRDLPDYRPADGWVLTYFLASATSALTPIVATDDGEGGHAVSVPASETATWPAATYSWQAKVTQGAETYTVDRGRMQVAASLTGVDRADTRTHAERVLDALEAMLEGKATQDQQSFSVGGRQLSRMTVEELLTWRDKYRAEVAREQQAARLAKGLDPGHTLRVRL